MTLMKFHEIHSAVSEKAQIKFVTLSCSAFRFGTNLEMKIVIKLINSGYAHRHGE
jgi:hypothetical protein